MSLPRETMLELMALADGELQGGARERAERLVAQNEEARKAVEAMRAPQLSAWLGEALQARGTAADGIADSVMAKLGSAGESEPSLPREGGGVVRLASSRRGRAIWIPVATCLALAAGAAVVVRSVRRDETEPVPLARVVVPSASPATAPDVSSSAGALTRAGPLHGVEVEEIDSPSRGVSVFEIPIGTAAAAAGKASPSSVVIWIDDEPRNP